MAKICPTITALSLEDYNRQIDQVGHIVKQIHVDLADGIFTPNNLISTRRVWWPTGMNADIHLMYQRPTQVLADIVALKPRLVIVQAEADGDFLKLADYLHHHGIRVGVALLPKTPVSVLQPALDKIDHVLIFSGNLGHQGGSQVDYDLLKKVSLVRHLKLNLEIGWDGGVNDANIRRLVQAGVDVVNVGGFIQNSSNPEAAYAKLKQKVSYL